MSGAAAASSRRELLRTSPEDLHAHLIGSTAIVEASGPYEPEGHLVTDQRSEGDGDTLKWEIQADWEAFQEAENVEIESGTVTLEPASLEKTIHQWPMMEGSGSTIEDTEGGYDATINGASWVSNNWKDGFALSGDGSDDWVSCGSLADYGSTLDTDTAWVYTIETTSSESNSMVAGNMESDWQNSMTAYNTINRDNTGDIRWWWSDAADNRIGIITAGGLVSDGDKHRVVLNKKTNDPINWEVWVDSVEVSTSVESSGTPSQPANFGDFSLFRLGSGEPSGWNHLDGVLDNVTITGDSLTSDEIQTDYDKQPWT